MKKKIYMKSQFSNKNYKNYKTYGFTGARDPSGGGRFKYRPFKKGSRKRSIILIIIIAAIAITLLTIFVFWPIYWASINLNYQLYNNKAGGLNFIDINFLNFWSNFFFWNKTSLIGAFIGTIIMSIPPDRILLTSLGTRLRFGKPSRKKTLLFWWTAGFFIFYLFGHLIDVTGQFSWTVYLIEQGEIDFNLFTIIPNAFGVLLNPESLDITSIFIYQNLFLPIILFTLGVFIFRAALKVFQNIYIRRNDYQLVANGLFIGSLVFGIIFFYLPTLALDGIQLTQIWAIVLGFFALLGFGLFVTVYGRLKQSQDPRNYMIFTPEKKLLGITGIIILIIIVMPLILSVGTIINLTNTEVYRTQQWETKFKRQVEWTTVTAGLDMFEERPIANFTRTTNSTEDEQMIRQIRQYDQDFAVQTISAKIATTFEGLADSDIVYFNNTEYWVAPKTVKLSQFAGDPVATNTQLYDHVEGFLAIDTFNGDLVNVTEVFNITENYPIFFGESESPRYLRQQGLEFTERLGGYDTNILLDTEWKGGIEKNNFTYQGDPDGTLTGLEGFYYTAGLGLWGYVTQPEHKYLINRNIKSRVQNILLPNMRIDADPYLVFNSASGEMYYAISIFTSIPVSSYSTTPIYRFLGVCLIDQWNGGLTFYENPTLNTTGDPTYPLWKFIRNSYDWKSAPDWLEIQMRYPEELYELQLEANYRYHVDDFVTWRRGDDFHERPEDGDVFYIETNLGEGIEFVGLDLVEYLGQEARTLAGMYFVRHGEYLGEAIFYHTRQETVNRLIGPKTARDSYVSEATQTFTLIEGARNGNTLIYPLLSSIYYYIPTYSTVGDIQNLNLAGFVNGFSRSVGYGDDADDAYNDIEEFPPGSFTLNSTADSPDKDGRFTLSWSESQYADSYEIYQNNTLLAELDSSQRTYEISGLTNGDYKFEVVALNDYGESSDDIEVTVLITIDYEVSMETEIVHPDDLARFRITLENINTNFSAAPVSGINVSLTLYAENNSTEFTIYGFESPLLNTTQKTLNSIETNYTVINNEELLSGEGLIVSGWVNSSISDAIIRYRWTIVIPGEDIEITDLEPISVLKF
ncbi:MAG: conserved membrane protein of unknown function [Promethearchaeota archaeon]|nr:MAG: conserved membrane protein of unknown function [Candidatus Lokiarchaeota archaeon]